MRSRLNFRPISILFAHAAAYAGPLLIIGPVLLSGCHDDTPPPPRMPVPVPSSDHPQYGELRESDTVRPMPPPPDRPALRAPFDDAPLVDQAPPEQPAFVDLYRKVGSPKITLFVNRTMQGDLVPVNTDEPLTTVTQTKSANGPVDVTSHSDYSRDTGGYTRSYGGWYDAHGNYHSYTHSQTSDSFSSKGPAEFKETTEVYLHPGQYDETQAKSLDYEAVENIMTDWIACQGQVTVISPMLARQRLTDEQVKELQAGRPQAISEVAQQLGADVLIQVQAHPTRQTAAGLEVRLVAEAMNTHGGQSLARATVDLEPPLTKTQINKYTRWLARKLMKDMTATWGAPPPPEMRKTDAGESTPPPGDSTPSAAPAASAPPAGTAAGSPSASPPASPSASPGPSPSASSYPPDAGPSSAAPSQPLKMPPLFTAPPASPPAASPPPEPTAAQTPAQAPAPVTPPVAPPAPTTVPTTLP